MLAADRGAGRAPEKRKKQRAAGAGGGAWACRTSLSCPGIVRVRLGVEALRACLRSMQLKFSSDLYASISIPIGVLKAVTPHEVLMSGVSLVGH